MLAPTTLAPSPPVTAKERLAPFLALLDARFAPLLFAVAPQAYSVYRWLWQGSDGSIEARVFSILGALGFEFVYVGAIAWSERQMTRWQFASVVLTAAAALIFSVAVAIYVHLEQGWWALLHAGFPVVAFFYTMTLHGGVVVEQVAKGDATATVESDGGEENDATDGEDGGTLASDESEITETAAGRSGRDALPATDWRDAGQRRLRLAECDAISLTEITGVPESTARRWLKAEGFVLNGDGRWHRREEA